MAEEPLIERNYRRDDDEVSLADIALVLVRQRRFIAGAVLIAGFVGLVLALTTPTTYTVTTTMVPEVVEPRGGAGGLAALRGLGIALPGTAAQGLRPEAFPSVLQSREVLLATLDDTVTPGGSPTTLREYLLRDGGGASVARAAVLRYTIGLPGLLLGAARGASAAPASEAAVGVRVLSPEEHEAIRALSESISSSVDIRSGMFVLRVTDQDPVVAAQVAEALVRHFTEKVRSMQSEKQRQTLEFVARRRDQARRELEAAESRLAAFVDRNAGIQSARLLVERDRLQRQVSFRAEVYSELERQHTSAELELERSLPVISTVEAPIPPERPSGPRRALMLALSLMLGGMVGIAGAFVRNALQQAPEDPEARAKIEEIRDGLTLWRRKGPRQH